jgi:hypothetical protein
MHCSMEYINMVLYYCLLSLTRLQSTHSIFIHQYIQHSTFNTQLSILNNPTSSKCANSTKKSTSAGTSPTPSTPLVPWPATCKPAVSPAKLTVLYAQTPPTSSLAPSSTGPPLCPTPAAARPAASTQSRATPSTAMLPKPPRPPPRVPHSLRQSRPSAFP